FLGNGGNEVQPASLGHAPKTQTVGLVGCLRHGIGPPGWGIWIYPGGYRGRSKGEDGGVVMWCTAGWGFGEDLCLPPFAPGRCSYNKNQSHPRPVGAPAPGANACLPRSHRGGAPTTKPNPTPDRRSTRPGCEWGHAWGDDCARSVRTVAVLLQLKPIQLTSLIISHPRREWRLAV